MKLWVLLIITAMLSSCSPDPEEHVFSVAAYNAYCLFDGIRDGSWFFFDHSYHVPLMEQGCAARTEYYGYEYSSAISKGRFFGVQFHPEKSGKDGSRLLANFLSMEA